MFADVVGGFIRVLLSCWMKVEYWLLNVEDVLPKEYYYVVYILQDFPLFGRGRLRFQIVRECI